MRERKERGRREGWKRKRQKREVKEKMKERRRERRKKKGEGEEIEIQDWEDNSLDRLQVKNQKKAKQSMTHDVPRGISYSWGLLILLPKRFKSQLYA